MSKPLFNNIRIIPRDSDFLNRKLGSRGEIFFDQDNNSLRLYDGRVTGGIELAKNDLSNIANSDFIAKAQAAGISEGSGSSGFSSVNVMGQSTLDAETSQGLLKFLPGSNIEITTDSVQNSITITSTVQQLPPQLGFSKIAVSEQTLVTASTAEDTLSMVGANGIVITSAGKTITIAGDGTGGVGEFSFGVSADDSVVRFVSSGNTFKIAGSGSITTSSDDSGNITISGVTGVTTFNALTDISTASLTIDKVYLPAITSLTVTNSGASSYLFDQYTGNNPTLYAISGTTISFKLTASGHPFLIQDGAGNNYNTGLIHVSTTGVVTTGSSAQGKDSGTLYWKVPAGISGGYRYQCSLHAPMVGSIVIKSFATL
jgi:plastocyanin